MKVFVVCHTITNRLGYTLDFIFNDLLATGYTIVKEVPESSEGAVIAYGIHHASAYNIKSAGILFEEGVRKVLPEVKGTAEEAQLFPATGSDHPFDIFSAVFYLVSRYEEYLPFTGDIYHRFPHTQSLAFRYQFLHYPVINKWVNDLALALNRKFPAFKTSTPKWKYLPTYDIDIAWAYRNKGFIRNLGGWIKSPGTARLKTLLNLTPDPFDSFSFLNSLHEQFNLHPIYFWLVAKKRGRLDRNISLENLSMQALIKEYAHHTNGLHPSWYSHDHPSALGEEKQTLEELLNKKITYSRQHYLRFTLPETYDILLDTGITDEYSMGYGTTNGFRASTSSPFKWFNLLKNESTPLIVHPFCFMDANSFYEQKQNAEESYNELMTYKEACKREGGTLITIFHNNFLGTDPRHKGWREMYQKFIQEVHS